MSVLIEHSDDWDKVRDAFGKVLWDVAPIIKGETAQVETRGGGSFSYRYVDLSDVLIELRRACHDHGLVFSQMPVEGDQPDKMGLRIMLIHGESGEWMILPATVLRAPADAQAYGSALTYLRRYQLLATFAIPTPDADDDGAEATRQARNAAAFGGKRTAEELAMVAAINQYDPEVRKAFGEEFRKQFHTNIQGLPEHRHREALLWVVENLAATRVRLVAEADPDLDPDHDPRDDMSPGMA